MKALFLISMVMTFLTTAAQKRFEVVQKPDNKKVEILYNGKLITAYCYFDSTEKPVLFPIKTLSGLTVTRGYPIAPRPGERTDHPHHTGLWMNYESVNGLDFWNNSFAIPAEKKPLYGSIRHQRILSTVQGKQKAVLTTSSYWVDHTGKVLLEEITSFTFHREGEHTLVIDRTSTLKAAEPEVEFKDVKDGFLGLRVAREMEMPSKQEDKFIDAHGNTTTVAAANNAGVTGMYVNKEGVIGDAVWSSQSVWACLQGSINDQPVSIAIIDHPLNVGYPTYWHARGYGLFAANPLGQKVFSNGKRELNYTLKKDEQVTFRYRIVIHEGTTLSASAMDKLAEDFSHKRRDP
jgi:hypothetical protein